jgi:ribonuclease HI
VSRFLLRTDGGARGNPGPAAAAFVLESPDGSVLTSGGKFLGETTNNVAEYEALLWGLRNAIDREARPLTVHSDSELMVRQLEGRYRVKNEGLTPLYEEARRLIARLGDVRVVHVRREDNRDADRLCNEAMDCRGSVGDACEPGEAGPAQGTLFG